MKRAVPKDDPEVPGQRIFLVSMACPTSERSKAPHHIFKVKYVASSEEEAKAKAEEMRELDPDFDIYQAPVGKWVPFMDDPLAVEKVEYADQTLTQLINSHRENQKANTENFMRRVERETQQIMSQTKTQGKGKETAEDRAEQESAVKDAVTTRFKIYQLDLKIESLIEQKKELETAYEAVPQELRDLADRVDLPKIDEVAPAHLKDMETEAMQTDDVDGETQAV